MYADDLQEPADSMKSVISYKRLTAAALLAASAVLGSLATAEAGGFGRERIYSDSYGNLVVLSPAGYKRIVVGRGYLAKRMRESKGAGEGPKVVYLDGGRRASRHCEHHAVLLHGRSYMYGLPDNVVPEPSRFCW